MIPAPTFQYLAAPPVHYLHPQRAPGGVRVDEQAAASEANWSSLHEPSLFIGVEGNETVLFELGQVDTTQVGPWGWNQWLIPV